MQVAEMQQMYDAALRQFRGSLTPDELCDLDPYTERFAMAALIAAGAPPEAAFDVTRILSLGMLVAMLEAVKAHEQTECN